MFGGVCKACEVCHPAWSSSRMMGGAQHPRGGGPQPFVSVGDHQLDAAQAAAGHLAQELRPEGLRLGGADVHAQHLPAAVGVHADGDRHRHGDDPAGLAHLHVGGVDPQIRPLAFDRPLQEGLHPLVDLFARPTDLAFGGQVALLADQLETGAQPRLQGLQDRRALFQTRRPALVGGSAADLGLDGVQLLDPGDRLGGDGRLRRVLLVQQLVEVAAGMDPAEGELDSPSLARAL